MHHGAVLCDVQKLHVVTKVDLTDTSLHSSYHHIS